MPVFPSLVQVVRSWKEASCLLGNIIRIGDIVTMWAAVKCHPKVTVYHTVRFIKFFLFLSLMAAWPPLSACAQTAAIALVQHASKDAGTTTSATLAFNANNTAGNWIGVCIRAGQSGQIFTVTDSNGNAYHRAVQFNVTVDSPGGNTLGIFYAENIAGGANTITVSDRVSGTMRFAILEYSGMATGGSLDVAAAAQGSSANPNSGNVTTRGKGD